MQIKKKENRIFAYFLSEMIKRAHKKGAKWAALLSLALREISAIGGD